MQRLFGQRHLQGVGNAVEFPDRNAARFGDAPVDGFPQRVHHLLHLPAVGVRHPVEDEGFDGALVFAGRRPEHLRLHAEFVEQPLVKHRVPRESIPHQPAVGFQVDAVGDRREVIASLSVGFVVGDHEFAALFELPDRFAQLLQTGHRDRTATVRIEVDAFDPAVARSGVDGRERLVERDGALPVNHFEQMIRKRIAHGSVSDRLRKVDLQNRVGLHGNRRFHRPGNADQNENPQKQHDETADHESQQPGQKHLDEFHNLSV